MSDPQIIKIRSGYFRASHITAIIEDGQDLDVYVVGREEPFSFEPEEHRGRDS